ncbi:MAG: archease [Deltaproteobacteria bacterium]|nr:archease [Deltaproteobacteria bacterium]
MGQEDKNFETDKHLEAGVWGPSREELMTQASTILMELMIAREKVIPKKEVEWTVDASNPEDLINGQLKEVIDRFEKENMVFSDFHIRLRGLDTIKCLAHGEPWDPKRHGTKRVFSRAHCDQLLHPIGSHQWMANLSFDV